MLEPQDPDSAGKRWDLRILAGDRADWPWFRPGIRIKVLWERDGETVALLAYDPGAAAPWHEHAGEEEIMVLEGFQEDAKGRYGPGSYIVNKAGSKHTVSSPGGCLVWIHWRQPVRFL
jgi:anti-sigma factor ChrR (cupin superfamily)